MEEQAKNLIIDWLVQNKSAMIPSGGMQPNLNMLESGLIDSMDFLSIIDFVGEKLGFEIDIANFEDSDLGTVAGIARQIAKQGR